MTDEVRLNNLENNMRDLQLALNDKLHEIDLQLTKVSAHLDSEQSNYTRIIDDLDKIVTKHEAQLSGDENIVGYDVRFDRLEQAELKRQDKEKWMRTVLGILVSGVLIEAAALTMMLIFK